MLQRRGEAGEGITFVAARTFAELPLALTGTLLLALPLALSLTLLAPPAQAQSADDLLARVLQHRLAEGPSAGELRFRTELDRARTERLPDVSLQQGARWNYRGLPDLSLGVSATVPLQVPRLQARSDLALKGLQLARHNAAAETRRKLYELRRSLRLLAHLEEMEALLEVHRSTLLEASPELSALAVAGVAVGTDAKEAEAGQRVGVAGGGDSIAYLEVDLALQRTRGERRLLAEAIERRHDEAGVVVPEAGAGRPTLPPLPAIEADSGYCRVETDETRRAGLVREEERMAGRHEAADEELQVTLDLNGDVRYAANSAGRPWQLGAGIGVDVVLPLGSGLRPVVSLGANTSALDQSSSLGWPGRKPARSARLREAEREAAYSASLREAELSARRAHLSFVNGERRLRLRRLTLAALEGSAAAETGGGGEPSPGLQQEILQAKADILGAELELDLAHLEFAKACGSDEQGGWEVKP